MAAAATHRPSPIAWLIGPALLLFVVFFVLPFAVMAVMSVYSGNPVRNTNAFATTRHYERFIVAMDCMSYSPTTKEWVKPALGVPALLAITATGRVLCELLE